MTRSTARRSGRSAALAAVTGLALTACATAGSGNQQGAPDPSDASTELTTEDVTLTLAYTDDPPTEALVDAFEAEHPNITVETQQTPFSDYVKSIKLGMGSSNPPDIAEYNPGAMRSLVPAGLVSDLTPYEDLYGWDESFPPASLEVLRSNEDATEYGQGGLYAVPGALSVLGVFYNKDLVEGAGVPDAPTSIDELEDDFAAVADSGTVPLSVGALQVGGFQVWNALTNALGDVQEYRDWVYGAPGSTIETPGAKEAAQRIVDWVDAGYIPESANATADSDAQADFVNGKSAYLVTGNWAASAIEEAMGENVGFFAMPQATEGDPVVASGASVAFSISAKSEHPDEAAAFLDFLASEEAAAVQLETGFMPVNSDTAVEETGVRGEIANDFARVIEDDGIVPFPDFASPDMIDRLTAGVQGLISKEMSPDEYLASLQDSWTEHHG